MSDTTNTMTPTIDEQAELLHRAAEMAARFEEFIADVDDLLAALRLDDPRWSTYRDWKAGADGMEMILRHIGCDQDCNRFHTAEEARAYLIANGWGAPSADSADSAASDTAASH